VPRHYPVEFRRRTCERMSPLIENRAFRSGDGSLMARRTRKHTPDRTVPSVEQFTINVI
jgi:hypothetical protein